MELSAGRLGDWPSGMAQLGGCRKSLVVECLFSNAQADPFLALEEDERQVFVEDILGQFPVPFGHVLAYPHQYLGIRESRHCAD